jgi:hypothetical protein
VAPSENKIDGYSLFWLNDEGVLVVAYHLWGFLTASNENASNENASNENPQESS